MSCVSDLEAYCEAQGLCGGSTEWPTSYRRVHDGTPETPVERLVVFTESGGSAPETPADTGHQGDAAWRRPQVQIRVRGRPWESEEAVAKAQAIWDAVHGLNAVTMGETEYIGTRCVTDLIPLGNDDNGRYEVTFHVEMTRPVRVPASL